MYALRNSKYLIATEYIATEYPNYFNIVIFGFKAKVVIRYR